MQRSLEFFFDFISPNAFLAWQELRDMAEKHQCELILKPVLFAGLLQAHNQVGPAEVAPKMRWMLRNCLRKAADLGITLEPPHSHPFNPLLCLRLVLASKPDERERITDILFRAVWSESVDVNDSAELNRLLSAQGFAANRLLATAGNDATKSNLRAETNAAIARGVFGVPTMIVDDELFFGFDDLPWLDRYLSGEGMIGQRQYSAWLKLSPSAWRKKQ